MKYDDLRGKRVVLTGASGFLGQHFADALQEQGCDLFTTDITGQVDFTEDLRVSASAHNIMKAAGRVDVLINNAAFNPQVGEQWEEMASWDTAMAVNLAAPYHLAMEAMDKGCKNVINVASIYGVVAPNQYIYEEPAVKPAWYTATKAGLIGLTKWIATYPHWSGRCNALSPGGVEREGMDEDFIGRYCQHVPDVRMAIPKDIVNGLLFLCSNASQHVNGANLIIDGGWTAW